MDTKGSSLYDVKIGSEYVISQLPQEAILSSYGFRTGQTVFKKRAYRLGGPVVIESDTSTIALGKDIAKKIIVVGAK